MFPNCIEHEGRTLFINGAKAPAQRLDPKKIARPFVRQSRPPAAGGDDASTLAAPYDLRTGTCLHQYPAASGKSSIERDFHIVGEQQLAPTRCPNVVVIHSETVGTLSP